MVNYAMKDTSANFEMKDSVIPLGKRKRGRKSKENLGSSVEGRETGLETVNKNKNGVVVDLERLADLDDPFGEELRKRTEGMTGNEEALLGFMRDLGGEWCSRRRRRKIVDASILGDALPVGWKLLLGLKRKEGRASIYCRRYISPGGQHFLSCKEVSTFLKSYFVLLDERQRLDQGGNDVQQYAGVHSRRHADVDHNDNGQMKSNGQQREIMLSEMNSLEDAQVDGVFECHKCNMTFDVKDAYLQHLLSSHPRTTRRYRLGSSVGDGVIIRDGKFECQFCHKVFQERRRYNGHVGIHVRNFVRGIDESPGQQSSQKRIEGPTTEVPARTSRMDALMEIAKNSAVETTIDEPNDESCQDKQNTVSKAEFQPSNFVPELNSESPSSEPETENGEIDPSPDQGLDQQNSMQAVNDETRERVGYLGNAEPMVSHLDGSISSSSNNQSETVSESLSKKESLAFDADVLNKFETEQEAGFETCSLSPFMGVPRDIGSDCNTVRHPLPDEVDKSRSIELLFGFEGYNSGSINEVAMEIVHETSEGSIPKIEVPEPLAPSLQQPVAAPASIAFSDMVDGSLCSSDQRHGNATSGFGELRLDEVGPFKINLSGQASSPVLEIPVDTVTSTHLSCPYGFSLGFGSDEVLLNTEPRHQVTTNCVWCGVEFNQDTYDSDVQLDSVGYMCPTCKDKIPG